jgi:hypothetical protein
MLANVYRLRMLGIVDIVSFHADPEQHRHLFAGIGLPVVLILSVAFSVRGGRPRAFSDFLSERWRRLMVPWFFWSAVYAALRVGAAVVESRPILSKFEPNMLLYGTWIHLWYLPFVFCSTLAAQPFHRVSRALTPTLLGAGLAAVAASLYLCAGVLSPEGAPWIQWTFAAPSLFVGLLFGRFISPELERRFALGGAALVLVVLLATWLLLDFDETPRRYLMAAGALTLVMAWPGRLDPVTRALADTFYGVYLIHPAILRFLDPFEASLGWVGATLVATAVSMVLTLGIRRTALRRFV